MEAIEKIVRFDEDGNATLKLGKHFSMKDAKIVVLIKGGLEYYLNPITIKFTKK